MTFSPGTYAIISGSDFLALDLSKRDGTTVIGYPLHGKPNQRWIVASRNGGFTIKNEQYGKFLNVDARGIHLHDADLIGVDDEFIWTVTPDKKTPNLFRLQKTRVLLFSATLIKTGGQDPPRVRMQYNAEEQKEQTWYLFKIA